jgi:hypothetical protein
MDPATTPSCLALQDVRGQGLQFGRPVRRGRRRPVALLLETDRYANSTRCALSTKNTKIAAA